MAERLRALGVEFEEIDVDTDPELRVRYGREVPVLVADPETLAKLR